MCDFYVWGCSVSMVHGCAVLTGEGYLCWWRRWRGEGGGRRGEGSADEAGEWEWGLTWEV